MGIDSQVLTVDGNFCVIATGSNRFGFVEKLVTQILTGQRTILLVVVESESVDAFNRVLLAKFPELDFQRGTRGVQRTQEPFFADPYVFDSNAIDGDVAFEILIGTFSGLFAQ